MTVITINALAGSLSASKSEILVDYVDVWGTTQYPYGVGDPMLDLDSFSADFPLTENILTWSGVSLGTLAEQQQFVRDFYNRIHVRPSSTNIGNVVGNQVTTFEIWNAFFTSKYLDNIAIANGGGLSLDGKAQDTTWEALESQIYTVTVDANGDPSIDADFIFSWTGLPDTLFELFGSRVAVMSFPMGQPVAESLEWADEVLTAFDGTEQVIRLRKSPRQFFGTQYFIPPEQQVKADNLIFGGVKRNWAIPNWTEAQRGSSVLIDDVVIPVDTTACDYRADGLVFLWQDYDTFYAGEVESVASGSVTLKRGVPLALSNPWVMPCRTGLMNQVPTRRLNGWDSFIEASFFVQDNIDFAPGASPVQFLGYDVLTDESLTASGRADEKPDIRFMDLDYKTGIVDRAIAWETVKLKRPYRVFLQGLPAIWSWRQFLHRRAGRQRPFWLPTFERNFRLLSVGTITNSLLGYLDNYIDFAPGRIHIAIRTMDDTWYFRTITGASPVGDDQVSWTIDSNLNIDASQIKTISFMGLKRLESARVQMSWGSNRTLQCQIGLVEVMP